MAAADEEGFWSTLKPGEIGPNVHGVPPYDVKHVARRVIADLGPLDMGDVLDLGCGDGRLTNEIAHDLGWLMLVHGVDISEPLLRLAAHEDLAEPNTRWLHCDGRRLPPELPDEIHGAWSITMFQHIPFDAVTDYIAQVANRLQPGGAFVFTLACGDDPPRFLDYQYGPADLEFLTGHLKHRFESVAVDATPDENGWTWLTCRMRSHKRRQPDGL